MLTERSASAPVVGEVVALDDDFVEVRADDRATWHVRCDDGTAVVGLPRPGAADTVRR